MKIDSNPPALQRSLSEHILGLLFMWSFMYRRALPSSDLVGA